MQQSHVDRFLSGRGRRGILNVGNTCYIAATLQLLAHCTPFVHYILSKKYSSSSSASSSSTALTLRDIFLQLFMIGAQQGVDKPIDARQFVSLLQGLPQFQGMTLRRQNDAQEFLAKLVEALALETSSSSSSSDKKMPRALTSADCLDADKVPLEVFMDRAWYDAHRNVVDSPLTNMMHGQLIYETICGHCQKRFPSSDVFLTLGIDVHDGDDGTNGMQRASLASCITSLFKSERIEGASWKCDACKQTPDFCTRVCRIWRAPETLLICIKRFDARTYHGKTRGELSLPKRIDFSQVVNSASPHLLHHTEPSSRPALYELRAVICHHGSARYGHYDALCRDSVDRSSWFTYDDESVQSIPANRIDDHGGAYILAYAKR